MIRKIVIDKKKMVKKSVEYLMSEPLIELSKNTKEVTNTKPHKTIRQALQKNYEPKFPNSLDYSNLTKPEMGIVSLIRVYREKHGMSKFRNKEINERFINADLASKCSFASEAIERIKSDEKITSTMKGYFVDRLETEKTKMLIELDDVQES